MKISPILPGKHKKAQALRLLLMGFLMCYGNIIHGGEEEVTSCLALIDNSTLYEACLQKNRNNLVDSNSTANQENGTEPCYCDIRKQKQVEIRLQRLEKQKHEIEENIVGIDGDDAE